MFETPEVSASQVEKMSPEEKFATFFKAVLVKDNAVVKDLGGGTGASGGYLIPREFAKEIIQELNKLTPMRQYATIYPVSSRVGEIAKETVKPQASRSGENQPAYQSENQFGQLTWALTRIDVFTAMSRELVADTPINITEFVRKSLAEAIAEKTTSSPPLHDLPPKYGY